jgi:glycosyltransferase involved in cell wall biosynthesis
VRILYTHTSSLIGGGNKVLLRLLQELDRGRYEPFSVLPERGPVEKELRRLEVPYCILDLRPGRRGLLADAAAAGSLAWQLARRKIDILHANDPLTYRLASIAAGVRRTVLVCHLHHPTWNAESLKWAYTRRPKLVLTPTEFVREKVCEWLGVEDAPFVRCVGNPVDVDWFSPAPDKRTLRERLGIDRDGPHVTVIGALAPHKGHDCFLHAAAILLRSMPGASFHVIGSEQSGDRVWAGQLRELARKLGIAQAVRFWGFVGDDVARDVLQASDLFVLPTQLEGFCLAVAEAQACGIPVLTSRVRPLDEVVRDGQTGWLLPQDEPQAFAERAAELLSTPHKSRSFAVAAREFVVNRFSHAAFVARVMEQYERVIG